MFRRTILGLWLGVASLAQAAAMELPTEELGQVRTLPDRYPRSWVLADYVAAPSISESKTEILEITPSGAELKGQIPSHQWGVTLASPSRPEIYVAETFYSRGERGDRTDAITVFDTRTLAAIGEIVLPGAKRGLFVKQPAAFALTDGDRLGLVFNFTPAASVTVVDLPSRKVLSEIDIPGCALLLPTGARGFSSLCANGTLLTITLDESGRAVRQHESAAFNLVDTDAMFGAPAVAGGVSYFPTLGGRIQPVDFREELPRVLPAWSLVGDDVVSGGWRPSGLQMAAADEAGRLYVLMRANAVEGDHKEGGQEVWVFDPSTHARTARIELRQPARSIVVVPGAAPMLVAMSHENTVDIYDVASGRFLAGSPVPALGAGVVFRNTP